MKTDPLVSVIVPVYNVEKFVGRCLNSIINQKYNNIEIIVVNDGSTDNSGKICDDFATIDQRVKVIHKNNGGVSSTRNKGLDSISMHSEYVLFVDGDDYINENTIRDNLYVLQMKQADIVCFNRSIVKNNEIVENKVIYSADMSTKDVIVGIYEKRLSNVVWDKLYKREVWDDIRFLEGWIFEDLYVMPYVLKAAKKIVCNDKIYYYYEKSNGSSISKNVGIKIYFLEFYGACIKAEVAKELHKALYEYSKSMALEYALKAYQYNIYTDYLSFSEKSLLIKFFKDSRANKISIKYKLYLYDLFTLNILNRIKGIFYLWRAKKNGWTK